MSYTVIYKKSARKYISKLDKPSQRRIIEWVDSNLVDCSDPRKVSDGKPLKGPLSDYWRYRVGDYRILAKISDNVLIIYIVDVEHRKKVY